MDVGDESLEQGLPADAESAPRRRMNREGMDAGLGPPIEPEPLERQRRLPFMIDRLPEAEKRRNGVEEPPHARRDHRGEAAVELPAKDRRGRAGGLHGRKRRIPGNPRGVQERKRRPPG